MTTIAAGVSVIFAHSYSNAGAWHAPFLSPGSYHLAPELDGLTWEQRWQLSQIVEKRFNQLAEESGSSAVWRQVQTSVFGSGFMLSDSGEVERTCGTTNFQLIEWRDKAIREVLDCIRFISELAAAVGRVLAK